MPRLLMVVLVMLVSGCDLPQTQTKISLPEPESEGAQVLRRFCSDCHAPPSPLVHTAKEWTNVIYRMQERRRMKAFELIGEPERIKLLEYLQKFAKS